MLFSKKKKLNKEIKELKAENAANKKQMDFYAHQLSIKDEQIANRDIKILDLQKHLDDRCSEELEKCKEELKAAKKLCSYRNAELKRVKEYYWRKSHTDFDVKVVELYKITKIIMNKLDSKEV